MPRWSITHLEDMPTLAVGPDADLKYDDGSTRVWLRRSPSADRPPSSDVVVEKVQADGTWQAVS